MAAACSPLESAFHTPGNWRWRDVQRISVLLRLYFDGLPICRGLSRLLGGPIVATIAPCSGSNSFLADLGVLTIRGVDIVDDICMFGFDCSVLATGVGLNDGDRMMLKIGSCTGLEVDELPDRGRSKPATVDGTKYSFGIFNASDGLPVYLKCWCKLDHTDCKHADDFQAFSGTLTLICPRGYTWVDGICACAAGTQYHANEDKINNATGLRECILCAANFYCDGQSIEPIECPGETTTGGESGVSTALGCFCRGELLRDPEDDTCGCLEGFRKTEDGMCEDMCLLGTYFDGEQCQSCPIGKFGREAGHDSVEDGCAACPLGKYGQQPGQGSAEDGCADCPIGTYGAVAGLAQESDCTACPLGTYGDAEGCLNCPVGKYNDVEGQTFETSCKDCDSQATRGDAVPRSQDCVSPERTQSFTAVSGRAQGDAAGEVYTFRKPAGEVFKPSAEGGQYAVCWCSGPAYALQSECDQLGDYWFEVGTLNLYGPSGGQQFICTLGHSCQLETIAGLGLQATDSVIVSRACGDGAQLKPLSVDERRTSLENDMRALSMSAMIRGYLFQFFQVLGP